MALLRAYLNGIWVDLPTPSPENYKTSYTHIEKSFRDSNGKLHRDIIRRNLAKVECGWNSLDGSQMSLLSSLYDFDSFILEFTDNKNNRVRKTVYAGPIEGKAMIMNNSTFQMVLRTDISMNFIEF